MDLNGHNLDVTTSTGLTLGSPTSTIRNTTLQNTGTAKSTVTTTSLIISSGSGNNKILTNGTYTIDLNVSYNWTNNETSGSNLTNSTVTFTGNSSAHQTVTTGGQAFYHLTINNDEATYDHIVISGNLDVNGLLKIVDGDLQPGANSTTLAGGLKFDETGGVYGTLTRGAGDLTFDGSGTLTDNRTSKEDLGGIYVGADSATPTLTLGTDVTVTNVSTTGVAGGKLDISGKNITLTASSGIVFTLSDDELTYNSSSVVTYTSGSDLTIQRSSFSNLTISSSSPSAVFTPAIDPTKLTVTGTFTITAGIYNTQDTEAGIDDLDAGNLTIDTDGSLTANSATINISGNWVNAGTFTAGDSTVVFNGTADQTVATNEQAFNKLTIDNTSGSADTDNVIVTGTLDVNGLLYLQDGELQSDGSNVDIGAGLTIDTTGQYTANGASLIIDGSGTIEDKCTTKNDLGNVSSDSGGHTVVLASDIKTSSFDYDDGSGTLTMTGKTITVASSGLLGDFGLNVGILNHDASSKVIFTASSGQVRPRSIPIPINVQVSLTGGASLIVPLESTLEIDADLEITSGTVIAQDSESTPEDITVTGDVTIGSSGALTGTSSTISVGGDWSNSGTFTQSTSNLTLNGSGAQNFTAGGTGAGHTPYKLTVTNSSSEGVTFADSLSLASGGTFADNAGDSHLTFHAGSTYTIPTLDLDGASSHNIVMRSSAAGTYTNFNITNAPTVTYVDVADNDAHTGAIIAANNSTNSGHNNHWNFGAGAVVYISGTVYTAESKSTNLGSGKNVSLSVNGAAKSTVATTGSGVFAFDVPVAANNTLTIFVDDGVVADKGNLVSQAKDATSDITGLEMYTGDISLRYETSGPMTNTLLDTADNCGDSYLVFSVSSGNATFSKKLWIESGFTYTPGGQVTTTGTSAMEIRSTAVFTAGNYADSIGGDMTITGTFTAGNSSNIITVGGNWSCSGTFTAGSSTVIFNGASTQTLNSGGTGAANLFNNLTHSGAGTLQLSTNALNIDGNFENSAGTLDANGLNITIAKNWTISGGSFSAGGTPGAQTVTFDSTNPATLSGSTTFNNLVMNTTTDGAKTITFPTGLASKQIISGTWTLDGDSGKVLTLQSATPATAWYFQVAAAFVSGDYITVTDSWSANSYKITPGTNVTNGGNNDGWVFNQTPTNDSLDFSNPYGGSGKTAICDNANIWQFQAKVTDADGPTDINYIEIRFANSSDNTSPYDALKYRYTRGTNTFSEEADTQDAAAIDSSSSASSAGNQWTVNFRLKFNDNFTDRDTEYSIGLYSIDNSAASDNDDYASKYKVSIWSLSFSLDSHMITFANLNNANSWSDTKQTVMTITTNAANGYNVSAYTDQLLTSVVNPLVTVSNYSGTWATPTTWGAGTYGFGYTSNDSSVAGSNRFASGTKYAGFLQTASGDIVADDSGPVTSQQYTITYKVAVSSSQAASAYTSNIVYIITAGY